MKIIKIVLITCTILLFFLATLFLIPPDYEKLNFIHKYFAKEVYEKWDSKISSLPKDERAIVDYDMLMSDLNFIERNFAEKILSINPKDIGFKGPYYSREKPGKLIKVESIKVGERETGVQYCPEHSFNDCTLMMQQMKADLGKQLFIDSGYRSPGRQAFLFFYYLVNSSEYSLKENARWIAMPGYSEHGHPVNNAIDFTSSGGINGFSDGQSSADFEKLEEFKWMMENAGRFNFYLSYPEDNPHGVAFEPWHWHWKIIKN